jgi:hypothetical protein
MAPIKQFLPDDLPGAHPTTPQQLEGYSTAGKILAAWTTDGSVTRTAGPAQAGRRAADTWTITDTTQDHVTKPTTTDQRDREITGAAPDTDADTTADAGPEEIEARDPGAAEQPTTSATPAGARLTWWMCAGVPVEHEVPG